LERVVKWTRRNPVVAGLSGTAVLVLLAGLAGVLFEWRQATANAIRATRNAERADASAAESRQRLVRLSVGNGTRLLREGDHFGALLWFAEALRLDSGNQAQAANHRLRLAAVLRQSPRLLQVFSHGGPVTTAAFSQDGRRLLSAGNDGLVWVWDTESGERVL